jgi:glycosyltransferase involved in cell wall biosynthesis
MIDHLPDNRFLRPEQLHLRRLGLPGQPRAGTSQLSARELVLLYRLAAAIPEAGRVTIVGRLAPDGVVMVAAGAHQRRGRVAIDGPVSETLPDGLAATAVPAADVGHETTPADLLVFADPSLDTAAEALANAATGALVAAADSRRREVLEGLVRRTIVPKQTEGGRVVDGIYWSRVDASRRPWQSTDPRASVIVPTHNRPDSLMAAVGSILKHQSLDGGFEVLVVENAPRPQLAQPIADAARTAPMVVRHLHEPLPGLHRGRHRGAVEARGAILVYVDDDVLTAPGWIEGMVAPFVERDVAIVGGPVRPLWESPPPTWVAEISDSYFSLLDLGERELELCYPQGAYGCNMAIRRDVLFEVGGFNPDAMGWDPKMFWLRGDGETGLHRKVSEAGYRVVYHPAAGLLHRLPASRVTPRAIRRRGLLVGLSHSFTSIRSAPRDGLLRLRLLVRAGRALGSAVQCATAASRGGSRRVRHLSDAWRYWGYAAQHVMAAVRPRVFRYITRPSFFTEEGP